MPIPAHVFRRMWFPSKIPPLDPRSTKPLPSPSLTVLLMKIGSALSRIPTHASFEAAIVLCINLPFARSYSTMPLPWLPEILLFFTKGSASSPAWIPLMWLPVTSLPSSKTLALSPNMIPQPFVLPTAFLRKCAVEFPPAQMQASPPSRRIFSEKTPLASSATLKQEALQALIVLRVTVGAECPCTYTPIMQSLMTESIIVGFDFPVISMAFPAFVVMEQPSIRALLEWSMRMHDLARSSSDVEKSTSIAKFEIVTSSDSILKSGWLLR
mmetsp:Transcript_39230/g.92513  ORF Transcript_39230/g.92513 Transcript_39230/m.92513 type:complete len:269 (-) Transcript_39230:374-1180(-)